MIWETITLLILCLAAIIDIKTRRIPNWLICLLLVLGVWNTVQQQTYAENIIGLFFPACVLFFFKVWLHFAIGLGDIKLVAAIGLIFGYVNTSIILLISYLFFIVYTFVMQHIQRVKMVTLLPFAPFLVLSSVIVFCFNLHFFH